MAAPGLPPLPPQLKAIQHYLRTAQELDKREPVVAYYCDTSLQWQLPQVLAGQPTTILPGGEALVWDQAQVILLSCFTDHDSAHDFSIPGGEDFRSVAKGKFLVSVTLPAQELRSRPSWALSSSSGQAADGRLYAMQTGMKTDSKNPECRKFLCKLMDQLEAMKKQLGDNEAITQEIVGCAHVENYALKLFLSADNEDRAGRFHKNMIKSFYTASLLIDVLTVFGELTDEAPPLAVEPLSSKTYIFTCVSILKPKSLEDNENEEEDSPAPHDQEAQPSSTTFESGNVPASNFTGIHIPPGAHAPANTPAEVPHSAGATSSTIQPTPQNIPIVDPSLYNIQAAGEICLTPEDFARAQKYCKYAGSALQYEDVSTAVQNLQKALKLLTTGRE
ncbi:hypothetical protein lerEdw1_018092 [Lerista edwardsae]|nr:hypothetical protein lerEdw1_018092 [Lerista edwardsae]